jgi:hypothetical protein
MTLLPGESLNPPPIDQHKAWLQRLKVGDLAFARNRGQCIDVVVCSVSPKQIRVARPTNPEIQLWAFYKENGIQIVSGYNRLTLIEPTDALKQQIADAREKQDLTYRLEHQINWRGMTLQSLRVIASIVDQHLPKKAP